MKLNFMLRIFYNVNFPPIICFYCRKLYFYFIIKYNYLVKKFIMKTLDFISEYLDKGDLIPK